jgi:phage recombination protein Bet
MTTALANLASTLAQRFGFDGTDLVETLKATAFKTEKPISDAQMTALLMVANEYGLNPWTREIYAFPDQRGGIVPIVGVDGWIKIVNRHPEFDGVEFKNDTDEGSVTCTMYRKDRARATVVTEFFEECKRNTEPWKNMPQRMLRHKALIQCARVAFGFALYDPEEGEVAAAAEVIDNETGEITKRIPQRKSEKVAHATESVERVEPEQADKHTADKPAQTGGISGGQVAYLRNKLKAAGVAEQSICDRFQVTALELLTVEAFDTVKSELLALT